MRRFLFVLIAALAAAPGCGGERDDLAVPDFTGPDGEPYYAGETPPADMPLLAGGRLRAVLDAYAEIEKKLPRETARLLPESGGGPWTDALIKDGERAMEVDNLLKERDFGSIREYGACWDRILSIREGILRENEILNAHASKQRQLERMAYYMRSPAYDPHSEPEAAKYERQAFERLKAEVAKPLERVKFDEPAGDVAAVRAAGDEIRRIMEQR